MAGTNTSGRGLRIALVVSLAVNLLVAGVLIGGFLAGGRGDDRRGAADVRALRDIGNVPFVMALERDDRAALVQSLAGRDDALRSNRDRLRTRFEAVLGVLRAEPFQPDALRALLADQRATLFERQQLGETLLIERLEQMRPDQRAAYADRLDRSLRRGPRNTPRP